MYYPLEYFLVVDKDTLLTSTHDKQDTMFVEVFCDKGTPIKLSHVGQENILTFIISNSECMDAFVKELKNRSQWEEVSKRKNHFRASTGYEKESKQLMSWFQEIKSKFVLDVTEQNTLSFCPHLNWIGFISCKKC